MSFIHSTITIGTSERSNTYDQCIPSIATVPKIFMIGGIRRIKTMNAAETKIALTKLKESIADE